MYLDPTDLGPDRAGRPFWELADDVHRVVRAAGGDLFQLDSLLPASGIGEERLRSDAQAPFLFVAALDRLAVPSLAFGHPPKGQPEGDPFGSMAWLAAFRLTWLGTTAEGDGHRIRWRPKKRNERGHIAGILLTVRYGDDGRPCQVDREDDTESTRDWLLAALTAGPRKVSDLVDEMLAELDDPGGGEADRIRERLSKALRRMRAEGWVERDGNGGRDVRWSLRIVSGLSPQDSGGAPVRDAVRVGADRVRVERGPRPGSSPDTNPDRRETRRVSLSGYPREAAAGVGDRMAEIFEAGRDSAPPPSMDPLL